MNDSRSKRLSGLVAACGLAGVLLVGCASSPPKKEVDKTAPLPAVTSRHFVRDAESVRLQLVKFTDKDAIAKYHLPSSPIAFELSRDEIRPTEADKRFLGIGEAVGALAGIVVDAIKAEVAKEAARHEQQFKQSTYADDFWSMSVTEEVVPVTPANAGSGTPATPVTKKFRVVKLTPNYAGYVLTREATNFTSKNERPAFALAMAFVPASHDGRIVLLKPTYLQNFASAARVSPTFSGKRTVNLTINTIVQNATFDKDGRFLLTTGGEPTLTYPGYDLVQPKLLSQEELKDYAAGYFQAPLPTGVIKVGSTVNCGVFKLFVAVTEKDGSGAQDVLLKVSEFVGSQKDAIVKEVSTRTGPPAP